MIPELKKTTEHKMQRSIEALKADLAKVRTGRAHTGILDHVMVEYYGSPVPISQVANITLIDARTIGVQPWEKPMIGKVEKAIRDSDLGLNPASQGEIIRVPMPALTGMVGDIQRLCGRHGYHDAVIFGHAKDANLHFMIDPDLREACEDVVLNRRGDATERLLDLAERFKGAAGREALKAALPSRAGYVGLLGARRRLAGRVAELVGGPRGRRARW